MDSPENEITTPPPPQRPPPPPSLEELSRRGVRSLFLPYIIGLISDSSTQQSQSPREVLVLVNFRTGSITMVEGSGQIEAFLRGKEGPLPASKASIEAMETVTVTEEGAECAICLTEFQTEAKEMPCKHRFHSGCIGKWLGIHGSCPICRFQMPAEEEKNNPKNGGSFQEEEEEEGEGENEGDAPLNGDGNGGGGFSGAGFVFHIYVAGSRRGESGLDSESDHGELNVNPDESGSGSDMDIDSD